jgi:hypothetical protein
VPKTFSLLAGVSAAIVLCGAVAVTAQTSSSTEGWVPLMNGRNFDGWYTFLPSTGKNNDPKKVFKMEDGMVHILDVPESEEKQEFGYLSSEREFSDCRIRVEYKWGVKRFNPNNENKRDSGLLYFFNGPDKIWPQSLEFQIQETDTGDLWLLDGTQVSTKIEAQYLPIYVLSHAGPTYTPNRGRIIKSGDFEDRTGWNTLELVLDGDHITQIVNGRAVMRAWDVKQKSAANPSQYVPVTKGRIMLQAEGAEVWFRHLEMKPNPKKPADTSNK